MNHDEPKQLKLASRGEGEAIREKKDKKEKESKGNKGVILVFLIITIVVSLIFYFSGGGRQDRDDSLGGQKVYQF